MRRARAAGAARRAARRALALAWLAPALAAAAAQAGELRGRLLLELPGVRLADVGPVVVYLEPLAAAAPGPAAAPPGPATLRQRDARFAPPFLAVARGQTVTMPNDDTIYHNVFSFSEPNDFDLGLYPAGESRSVSFRNAGAVRVYCSIHESMNATLFVAPTPWFTIAGPDGRFALSALPEGRFRLRTWAEKLPPAERVVVLGGGTTTLDVRLGEPGP
jgi:plastocyanin